MTYRNERGIDLAHARHPRPRSQSRNQSEPTTPPRSACAAAFRQAHARAPCGRCDRGQRAGVVRTSAFVIGSATTRRWAQSTRGARAGGLILLEMLDEVIDKGPHFRRQMQTARISNRDFDLRQPVIGRATARAALTPDRGRSDNSAKSPRPYRATRTASASPCCSRRSRCRAARGLHRSGPVNTLSSPPCSDGRLRHGCVSRCSGRVGVPCCAR